MSLLVWGYKPDGSACVFDLSDGEQLPPGWSGDHLIIEDETKRTAEAITAAAGSSVLAPVIPSKFCWPFDKSSGLSPGLNPAAMVQPEPKKRRGAPPGGWPKKLHLVED